MEKGLGSPYKLWWDYNLNILKCQSLNIVSYINILSNLLQRPNFSLELLVSHTSNPATPLGQLTGTQALTLSIPPNFFFLMTLPIAKIQMKNPSLIPFIPFFSGAKEPLISRIYSTPWDICGLSLLFTLTTSCLGDCRNNPLVPLLPVVILSSSSSHTVRVIMLKREADHITPLLRTFRESYCFQYQA